MKRNKKIAFGCFIAGLVISSTAFAVDWKGFHAAMFTCMAPPPNAACNNIETNIGGVANTSTSTRSLIAPLVRDAHGNVDVWVYFKAGTHSTSACWVSWYGPAGEFGGSVIVPNVMPTSQFHNGFIPIPSAAYATSLLCTLAPNAVLVGAEYGEG